MCKIGATQGSGVYYPVTKVSCVLSAAGRCVLKRMRELTEGPCADLAIQILRRLHGQCTGVWFFPFNMAEEFPHPIGYIIINAIGGQQNTPPKPASRRNK